jgi:hypothetical protein
VRKPFLVCWKRQKFRAQAIFSLLEKTHPRGSQNLSSRNFFHYSTLQVPKEATYIKGWILIAVLRNWEQFQICLVFFYTPCIEDITRWLEDMTFYLRVVKTIFYERAQRVSKLLFLTRKDKSHIFKPTCNVLFII